MFEFKINLHLFDGAAAGASGGDGGGMGEGNANSGGTEIIYGKVPEVKDENPVAGDKKKGPEVKETQAERRKRYEEAIKGEFKEFDTERIQGIIDRRFKDTKELEEKLGATEALLTPFYDKYKVESGNIEALKNAIDTDNTLIAEEAEAAGMSVEAFREFKKMKAESDKMKRDQAQNQRMQEMQERIQRWDMEATECRETYPEFDMSEEIKNPQFKSMLRAGVPVKHAYEVLHLDKITAARAAEAARDAEKKVTDNIRAKGMRPSEGGSSAGNGAIIKSDVSTLTKRDRAEIAKRVQRGEKIVF